MNRRLFLALSGVAFTGAARRILAQSAPRPTTVETTLGRIRGSVDESVHVFKGVRYGASTAGTARFLPPSRPEPWTGVREATAYGPRAPQPFRRMVPEIGDALVGPGPVSEDCLFLNVWTPGPARNQRRPVMVWLHGGGFRTGSGNSVFYEGKSLAQKHGVVVVTVTHRLNVFGFLHLADVGGDQFWRAGNVGMLDLVLALEWVRDNIDAFGGDPRSVTIFGQRPVSSRHHSEHVVGYRDYRGGDSRRVGGGRDVSRPCRREARRDRQAPGDATRAPDRGPERAERHLDEIRPRQRRTNVDSAPVRADGVGIVGVGSDDVRLE